MNFGFYVGYNTLVNDLGERNISYSIIFGTNFKEYKNEETMVNHITNRIPLNNSAEPMVGQDKLQVPTLSINNFKEQEQVVESLRVFLGISNILTENEMMLEMTW